MRYNRIEIYGFGADLVLPFDTVATERFQLVAAEGLGPPEKEMYVATDVNGVGDFQNDLPQLRQPVLRIRLNPDYDEDEDASDLRRIINRRLYATAYQSSISMAFFLDSVQVGWIDALYTKKIEINPFSLDPEVAVTFQAMSPYIIGDSIAVDSADFADPTNIDFGYEGEDSTGFSIFAEFTADRPNLILDQGGYPKKIELDYAFLNGDLIVIDTQNKVIKRNRGGWKDLVGWMSGDSRWLKISPGANHFEFNTGQLNIYSISYEAVIWGV